MKRVIKIGGRAQSAVNLAEQIASAWRSTPRSFCVVHGGGDEVSELQRLAGREPRFIDGRRFTAPEDIDLLRMVLSGLINKRLVSNLVALGVPAAGLSGEDAATITALPIDAHRLGRAGKPVTVNIRLIQTLAEAGYLPMISPLAADDSGSAGEALNINGDDAAAAIAVALEADELLLIADVDGVSGEDGGVIPCLDQAETIELARSGTISGGMVAKLDAGFLALEGGVRRIRITSLEGIMDPTVGTLLTVAGRSTASVVT